MGTNDQIQNEASHILYTECQFILVVGHNPEWIDVAKRALERHAQYIHKLEIELNWNYDVRLTNNSTKDLGMSLESCRYHLIGFRNLRSIAVTWEVWEWLYNWDIYGIRERHLPNTIRCAMLKPVDQLWDIISEDRIASQILVQDPEISRSDINAICAAIHNFIGTVIKDMTATKDCLRLESGNAETQHRI